MPRPTNFSSNNSTSGNLTQDHCSIPGSGCVDLIIERDNFYLKVSKLTLMSKPTDEWGSIFKDADEIKLNVYCDEIKIGSYEGNFGRGDSASVNIEGECKVGANIRFEIVESDDLFDDKAEISLSQKVYAAWPNETQIELNLQIDNTPQIFDDIINLVEWTGFMKVCLTDVILGAAGKVAGKVAGKAARQILKLAKIKSNIAKKLLNLGVKTAIHGVVETLDDVLGFADAFCTPDDKYFFPQFTTYSIHVYMGDRLPSLKENSPEKSFLGIPKSAKSQRKIVGLIVVLLGILFA